MELFRFTFILFIAFSISPFANATDGWTTDIKAALAQAKKEKKDLLVDFSGSDWCHWCQVLDREVFSQPEFNAAVSKEFIPVVLDFPNDTSKIPPTIQKQNDEFSQRLKVQGFPTVILLDHLGRPYATTGYREGGPKPYLGHLEDLKDVKKRRDALFAKADNASGVEKAKLLDKAIQTVGVDLAMVGYMDTIKSIIQLDPDNVGGVRKKYEAGMSRQLIVAKVEEMMADFHPSKAPKYVTMITELEKTYKPKGKLRMELRGLLAQVLIIDRKSDEAVKIAGEFIGNKSLHPMEVTQWRIVRAAALASGDKTDASIKELDGIIATNPKNIEVLATCKAQKAQTLVRAGRAKEAATMLDKELANESNQQVRQYLTQVKQMVDQQLQASSGTEKAAVPN